MTKAERTRQYIIETTAPLFNTKGFEGTSLSDLMEATGLTKGSLYGNFRDKEEISTEAFRYSMRKVREMVMQELTDLPTYKKQLIALFNFYAEYVFSPPVEGGCPLLNTAVEADDHHTSMRKVVVKEILRTIDFITKLLTKGVAAGEFKKTIKPKEIAYSLFCAIEGAIIFSRVEQSREPIDIIVRHCKTMLDQISK